MGGEDGIIEDEIIMEAGRTLTLALVYLFALLSVFQMGVWKSLLFTFLVVLCCTFRIGQRRFAQAAVAMLFLMIAVSAELLPPVPQWGPAVHTYLKPAKVVAEATP